jgi:hypothetical protein
MRPVNGERERAESAVIVYVLTLPPRINGAKQRHPVGGLVPLEGHRGRPALVFGEFEFAGVRGIGFEQLWRAGRLQRFERRVHLLLQSFQMPGT